MAKSSKSHQQAVRQFEQAAQQAVNDGMVPVLPDGSIMPMPNVISIDDSPVDDPVKTRLRAENNLLGEGCTGGVLMGGITAFDTPQNVFMPIPEAGTPGLGAASWGRGNTVPVAIYRASSALTFTASAIDYLERTLFGTGPQVMYCITRYSGGTITHEEVPYHDAEVYLRADVARLMDKLQTLYSQQQPDNNQDYNLLHRTAQKPSEEKPDYNKKLIHHFEKELERANSLLESYYQTRDKMDALLADSNINYFLKRWIADTVRLGICFPVIGLSRSGSGQWNTSIVRFDIRDASVMRLEERNPLHEYKIDNVYYSERWRDEPGGVMATGDYVSYPCVMPEHAISDLRAIISANHRTKVSERPHWICTPNFTPTPTKPYYPQLAWWSIFPSQVYQYASTLIYDKAATRKNSTMWGKILFINIAYLKQVFDQAGEKGKTPEGQAEIRSAIYGRVEDFLKRRDNNGKLLVMDSYPSADEKQMIDSIRIVDVPRSDDAKANAADIAECASMISYGLGVNMDLVGSRPWTNSSSTGTAQRNLHLLKNGQLSPDRITFTDFFNGFVFPFNGFDPHFRMVINYPTLTTLDNSKTGTVDQHDGN